jgi:hypothetical protein
MNDTNRPAKQSEVSDFAGPLGSATSGRLVFSSGAAGVTLQADPALPDLFRAHFEQHIPNVRLQGGTVTIQYRNFSFFNGLIYWREPIARVTLNGSLPWEIEFRDGVSKLNADLSSLQLRAFDLGSASQVTVTLPQPSITVFVHVSGSASNITIHRPAGVAVRVSISGSASNLSFDEHYFAAVAGGLRWQTHNYNSITERYDLSISGSASDMTIAAR